MSATRREVILKPSAPPRWLLRGAVLARYALDRESRCVTLFEDKVHVHDTTDGSATFPRRYTLTHDDATADLYLSIGPEYDAEALAAPRTMRARDEVLAELSGGDEPRLSVSCTVGGPELTGRCMGSAARQKIFQREMPLAIATIRYGDRFFFEQHAELDRAEVVVEYRNGESEGEIDTEPFGPIGDYRVSHITGETRRPLAIAAAVAVAAVGIGALVVGRRRRG